MNATALRVEAPLEDETPVADARSIAVSVEAVSKTFAAGRQKTRALHDVSLNVRAGEFVSLVGRSGSGKSTLLRLIAGLLPVTEGRVLVDGRIVDGPPASARYVFQDYGESLFPWLSARDNVAFGARSAGDDRRSALQAADHFLDLVGLQAASARYPWELSGGMQQRLAIARALASRPRLILMDEPFGAVDALSRAKLQDLILSLWAELDLTVILVTHDIDEAVYLSDRVVVLEAAGQGLETEARVDLPRPRDQLASREDLRFPRYRRDLLEKVLL